LVEGESYRVGQLGAFVRIPLGYTDLYAICTQVGADAAPPQPAEEPAPIPAPEAEADADSYRWMSVSLFGEAVGGYFDRGVGQYPTIGDEVHLVTSDDLEAIYRGSDGDDSIVVGRIASSSGLPARLQLSTLVSRHSSIVGSTGAGKSNLVAVILDALSSGDLPNSRTLVIDPHGEYGSSVGDRGRVIYTGASPPQDSEVLRVPYWALPFDELIDLAMGEMQPLALEALRDRVAQMKRDASQHLKEPPPLEAITADTPVPFSIRKLWLELETEQRASYKKSGQQTRVDREEAIDPGDAEALRPPQFPDVAMGSVAPYAPAKRLPIARQLDLLNSRLRDSRFRFMFDRDDPLHPDLNGKTEEDIDTLLTQWVGGEKPVTVLDISGIPPEVLGTVVGTMLRLIYDALFWAMDLAVGGRKQPLLIILDEAHRFLPENGDSPANRVVSRIAKEGRKYGVGLMVVTQRPSDVDSAVLSQCGTMIALRVTNQRDRSAVASTIPDDLGDLSALLPALRTGEALVLGDALQVPSRIRVDKAARKPIGEDPPLPGAWLSTDRPDPALYRAAVKNWRRESTSTTEN
jgi:DNA helicase HerA-like ATPase